MFLDELIDEGRGFTFLQLRLCHSDSVEEIQHVLVQLVRIENLLVRIPTDMLNVPEIRWSADVILRYLYLLSFTSLLVLFQRICLNWHIVDRCRMG